MAPRKTTTNGQFQRQAQQEDGPGQAQVGPHHEDVAVGEVDHGEDAVHHGVAQGDEGVDAPQLQGVQDILGQELEHGFCTKVMDQRASEVSSTGESSP